MPAGRPRKSEQQHRIEGTYRHNEHGHIGGPSESGQPVQPDTLNADGRWLWEFVLRHWMTELDSVQLQQLCETWQLVRAAQQAVNNDPLDRDARTAWTAYSKAFNSLAGKFGLNPSDRAKLPKMADKIVDDDDRYFGIWLRSE